MRAAVRAGALLLLAALVAALAPHAAAAADSSALETRAATLISLRSIAIDTAASEPAIDPALRVDSSGRGDGWERPETESGTARGNPA